VFIIAPQDSGNEYLKIMAELGSFLDTDGKIDTLAKAKNEEELYHTFLKLWEEYLHQDTQNL
jgi:mannitol/fructose-specific phosphotransferase system IIA component (Ntr-type)